MSPVAVEVLTGADVDAALDDLARLRIDVFRAWPYLYDGDLDYERNYLAAFAAAPGACLVAARDGNEVVGASTAAPLAEVDPVFRAPFEAAGEDVSNICYLGESVLDARYRGQGIGHAFFDKREAHARSLGLTRAAFCAVDRPDDHPLKQPTYVPLDGFWTKRGYVKRPEVTCALAWRDVGDAAESSKSLTFWTRVL